MPIRHLVLALPIAACLAPEPSLGEQQDNNIICTPLCTPGYASLLEDTYNYGFRLFPDAGTIYEGCADLGAGWECVVTMLTPSNSCGAVVVDCKQQPGAQRPRCTWANPDGCQ